MTTLLILFILLLAALLTIWRTGASKSKIFKRSLFAIGIFSIVLALILVPIFSSTFKQTLFTKTDVSELLSDHDIQLEKGFKFLSKNVHGVTDHIIEFELELSQVDHNRVINQLQNSSFYTLNTPKYLSLRHEIPENLERDTTLLIAFEELEYINSQSCQVLANGYVKTWDQIRISKKENKLFFIREQ